MTNSRPQLSIVIPAYNEVNRLRPTLDKIRSYFATQPAGWAADDVELIVVDDGSTDGTARLVEDYNREIGPVRLVSNGVNRGKGYSVKHGVAEARGRVALFTDADLSSPIEECQKLLAAMGEGYDVAIGSRGLDRSLVQERAPAIRQVAGRVFNYAVRLILGLPFYDTQCGFKAFMRDHCLEVLQQQRIERFGFDPEILFLARKHGLRIKEIPVRWSHDPGSKVRLFRDSMMMFWDLVYVRWYWFLNAYR